MWLGQSQSARLTSEFLDNGLHASVSVEGGRGGVRTARASGLTPFSINEIHNERVVLSKPVCCCLDFSFQLIFSALRWAAYQKH